jgi:hypothetical protein
MGRFPKEERKRRARVQLEDEQAIRDYFEALDFQVTKLDKDNPDKRPDFLVQKREFKMYVEVKSFFGQAEQVTQEYWRQFAEENFEPPADFGWILQVHTEDSHLEEKGFRRRLKAFSNRIEDVHRQKQKCEVTSSDGSLTFTYDPRSNVSAIMFSEAATKLNTTRRLRDDIKTAADQFEGMKYEPAPKILIIYKHDLFLDEGDVDLALFGDLTAVFSRDASIDPFIKQGRSAGIQQGKNSRISAVCLCTRAADSVQTASSLRFSVFHNPYSPDVLPVAVFAQEGNRQKLPIRLQFEWREH